MYYLKIIIVCRDSVVIIQICQFLYVYVWLLSTLLIITRNLKLYTWKYIIHLFTVSKKWIILWGYILSHFYDGLWNYIVKNYMYIIILQSTGQNVKLTVVYRPQEYNKFEARINELKQHHTLLRTSQKRSLYVR